MGLEKIAKNIRKSENGIYYSNAMSDISYPEDGNEKCLQLEEDSFWFQHRNNVITEAVKKYGKNKSFFDIGGGNGFVSKRLQEEGIEVVLVEPGKKGAMHAYKRGVKNIICSTLEDASFVPESIDSVGLFDVVEHIEKDDEFMQNINRYMKQDGLVYITVPAYNMLWSNEDDFAGHYRRYTIKTITKLLNNTGFEIEYATYIFSVLPLPIFLFRTIPGKLGLDKKSGDVEKNKNEHTVKEGIGSKLMQKIWDKELNKIKEGKKISFGGSCFIVARKK